MATQLETESGIVRVPAGAWTADPAQASGDTSTREDWAWCNLDELHLEPA